MSRTDIARDCEGAARIFLCAALIALPWRWAEVLEHRPISPVYGDFTHLILYAHETLLLVTLLLWIIHVILARKRLHSGPLLLTVALVGLSIVMLISSLQATDVTLGLYQSARSFWHLGLYFLLIHRLLPWAWIVGALSGGLLVQSGVSILQLWLQHDAGWQRFGERVLSLGDPNVSIIWGPDGWQSLRAYGLTDHPNILGMHLALVLVLLVGWLRHSRSVGTPAALLALTVGTTALFLTFFRVSWSALAVGIMLIVWLDWRYRRESPSRNWAIIIATLLILIIPLVWTFQPYLQLGNREFDVSLRLQESEAKQEMEEALTGLTNELLISQPALGVGPGNLPLTMREREPDFIYNYQPPFNTMATVAAELGLFGGLFYLLALVAPWLTLILQHRQLVWNGQLIAAYGLLAAIIWLGFFDAFPWSFAAGRFWQLLAWGLWAMAYLAARVQNDHNSQRQ